jgi:hypothetical protein
MSISLKENLDRVMNELDSSLTEMELIYHAVHETLVALCQPAMAPRVYSGELERGIKYVQDMYFTLVSEIKGILFAGVLMDSTERFMVSVHSG